MPRQNYSRSDFNFPKYLPKVSILMPIYNTEGFLKEAIEAVRNQTYKNWELICVNDGSTDNCSDILDYYKKKDQRIVIINQPHSGSVAGGRNGGLNAISGDYIVQLDSDDKIENEYVEKLVKKLICTNAETIISRLLYWDWENDLISNELKGIKGDIDSIISGTEAFRLSLDWEINGVGMYQANIIKKYKYDTESKYSDEYTTRLLLLNSKTVAFSDAQYYYRINKESVTNSFNAKNFDFIKVDYRLLLLLKEYNFDSKIITSYTKKLLNKIIRSHWHYLKKKHSVTTKDKKYIKSLLIETNKKTKMHLDDLSISFISKFFLTFCLTNWIIMLVISPPYCMIIKLHSLLKNHNKIAS